MLRFIDIGFQLHNDTEYFSFYDTVTDKYLNWNGMYIFESEREFREYAIDDEIYERCCLIAFWDGQSRGTKNVIELAIERGLKVRIIKY